VTRVQSADHNEELTNRDSLTVVEETMATDPDASEWRLLQDYFAALSDHDPAQERQPVEAIFDAAIRRRFGDCIARSAQSSRSKEQSN
jgi:hypothetical protein